MPGIPPTAGSLSTLLRLIDDETPEVRNSVADALKVFEGDVSEILGSSDLRPDPAQCLALSRLLIPARRERLRREWIVPAGGAYALNDDWDRFEALLRILSDYLHDGISLRQPLGDALDFLAEEVAEATPFPSAGDVCSFLFSGGRLRISSRRDPEAAELDLAAVIAGGPSHSLGLGLIALLVAQRLEVHLEGVNVPGSFFCRFAEDEGQLIIDPAAQGAAINNADFTHRIRRHPREVRELATRPALPGELLLRVVEDLSASFSLHDDEEDTLLMEDLIGSLLAEA